MTSASTSTSETKNAWRQSSSHTRQSAARDRTSSAAPASTPSPSNTTPTTTSQRPASSTPASLASHQGNAWTGDRSRSVSAARGVGRGGGGGAASAAGSSSTTTATTGTGPAAAEESEGPVGGFNREEVREYFKRAYQDATAGDLDKVSLYSPVTEGNAARAGGAWGTKPSNMANGQDFWVQLKKQVAAREAGG